MYHFHGLPEGAWGNLRRFRSRIDIVSSISVGKDWLEGGEDDITGGRKSVEMINVKYKCNS